MHLCMSLHRAELIPGLTDLANSIQIAICSVSSCPDIVPYLGGGGGGTFVENPTAIFYNWEKKNQLCIRNC